MKSVWDRWNASGLENLRRFVGPWYFTILNYSGYLAGKDELNSGRQFGVDPFPEIIIVAELRRPEWPPSGAPYLSCEREGNPWVDFLMVIMASGIARGRVRTTTTESRNMAAILAVLQKRGWQRHKALVYPVLLWYWTSMLRSIDTCQNRVSADQYYVAISRAQVNSSVTCFFEVDRWPFAGFPIGSRTHVRLTCWKQGRIVLMPDLS